MLAEERCWTATEPTTGHYRLGPATRRERKGARVRVTRNKRDEKRGSKDENWGSSAALGWLMSTFRFKSNKCPRSYALLALYLRLYHFVSYNLRHHTLNLSGCPSLPFPLSSPSCLSSRTHCVVCCVRCVLVAMDPKVDAPELEMWLNDQVASPPEPASGSGSGHGQGLTPPSSSSPSPPSSPGSTRSPSAIASAERSAPSGEGQGQGQGEGEGEGGKEAPGHGEAAVRGDVSPAPVTSTLPQVTARCHNHLIRLCSPIIETMRIAARETGRDRGGVHVARAASWRDARMHGCD